MKTLAFFEKVCIITICTLCQVYEQFLDNFDLNFSGFSPRVFCAWFDCEIEQGKEEIEGKNSSFTD